MAIGTKTGGKPFPRGNKLAKGGKRPGTGRPTKAAKKVQLELKEKELAIAKDIWEREIGAREQELARKHVERALENDAMLRDLRHARIPDAQNDKDHQDKPPIIYKIIDANSARDQARLEKRRSKLPQD